MYTRTLRDGSMLLLPLFLLSMALAIPALATAPEEGPFARTWARTDQPVSAGIANRTWMWGPEAMAEGFFEPFAEAHNNGRFVQYFEKARMEISHLPDADIDSVWYVTTGLLAKEMITGDVQVGEHLYEDSVAADIPVAGDPDDRNSPTYATFSLLLDAPARDDGSTIITRVDPSGVTSDDEDLAVYGVTSAQPVDVPGISHQVASPFWAFMTSQGTVLADGEYVEEDLFLNPFYATGFPLTEAYWATVLVGSQSRDVLMQCFERRCLTFTPDNPEAWQVESGNVGMHYYQWRYEQSPPVAPDTAGSVYAWDIGDWDEFDDPGYASVSKVGGVLRISGLDLYSEVYVFADPALLGDGPADVALRVDLRMATPDTVGFGCLAPRFAEDAVSYSVYLYCVDDLGAWTYWYESFNFDTGDFTSDLLMTFRGSNAAHPVDAWNTISVIMDGDTHWLYVNDDLVGVVEDDRLPAGEVGMYVINFDDGDPVNPVTFEFRNLSAWDLD